MSPHRDGMRHKFSYLTWGTRARTLGSLVKILNNFYPASACAGSGTILVIAEQILQHDLYLLETTPLGSVVIQSRFLTLGIRSRTLSPTYWESGTKIVVAGHSWSRPRNKYYNLILVSGWRWTRFECCWRLFIWWTTLIISLVNHLSSSCFFFNVGVPTEYMSH